MAMVQIYWKYVDFRLREFVTYIVVVAYDQPNPFAGVTCKHNLEVSFNVERSFITFIQLKD